MPLNIWNGSAWTQASGINVWNGSSWVPSVGAKIWNGSAWVDFYFIDTQTVTVGLISVKGFNFYGYFGSAGDISDGTFTPISDAPIVTLGWATSNVLQFRLSGSFPDAGWTSINIDGNIFTRASRSTFDNTTGGNTQWTWNTATNPFGTTVGATKVCNFL